MGERGRAAPYARTRARGHEGGRGEGAVSSIDREGNRKVELYEIPERSLNDPRTSH